MSGGAIDAARRPTEAARPQGAGEAQEEGVAMRVADRVTDVTDRVQTRRLQTKRESLDRDNERLRIELRTMRDELERERSARDELLDALTKNDRPIKTGHLEAKDVTVKTKRRGGLLRLLIIGGGAYVLGTRAGHERYEQLRSWASSMKDRMRGPGGSDEWASMSPPSGFETGPAASTGSTSTGSTSAGTSRTTGSTGTTPSTGQSSTGTGGTSPSPSTKPRGTSGSAGA